MDTNTNDPLKYDQIQKSKQEKKLDYIENDIDNLLKQQNKLKPQKLEDSSEDLLFQFNQLKNDNDHN